MIIIKYGNRFKLILMIIFQVANSFSNLLLAYIISAFIRVAGNKNLVEFKQIVWLGVIGFFIFGIINYLTKYFQIQFIQDINQNLKRKLVNYYLRQESNKTSQILSLLTNDMKQLETSGIKAEITIIGNLLSFIVALLGSLTFDFFMTLVCVLASFLPFFISKITEKSIKQTANIWTQDNSAYVKKMNNLFHGIATIVTYQAYSYAETQADISVKQLEKSLANMERTIAFSDSIIYLVSWLTGIILPFGFGILRIIQGNLSLSAFLGVVQLSNSFTNPIIQAIQLKNQLATVDGILTKIELAFNYEQIKTGSSLKTIQSLTLQGAAVKRGKQFLLKPTTLLIHAQEKLLIMAPSGYGKSTLLKVFQQQTSLTEGQYLINGQPIIQFNKTLLQSHFALIQQTPFMFADTLYHNLTLGKSFSDQDLTDAIKMAGLTELITEKGLDYSLEEDDTGLSGGQIQRIEIARAILRQRPFLLVDEGTSALDHHNAAIIRETLKNYPGAVIEVGHKLAKEDITMFDRVIHLED